MTIVLLLISEGSWLVFLTAENATLALPERTEMPSAVPVGSEVGLESHTTRHFPSRTMGSVSFCARVGLATSHTALSRQNVNIADVFGGGGGGGGGFKPCFFLRLFPQDLPCCFFLLLSVRLSEEEKEEVTYLAAIKY
jgi:hypothetical protein